MRFYRVVSGLMFAMLFLVDSLSVAAEGDSKIVDVTRTDKPASKVHFAIFANTQADGIGSGVKENRDFLLSIHEAMRNANNTTNRFNSPAIVIHEGDFTRGNILSALNTLVANVGSNDVVFVHISTHGSFSNSSSDWNLNHSMQDINRDFIKRAEVLNIVKGKGRLTVLLTDSCTSRPGAVAVEGAAPAAVEAPPWAIVDLLFHYQGTVNISSSTPPQFTWYTTEGGFFTREFCRSAVKFKGANSTGWEGFFKEIQENVTITANADANAKANGGQTIAVFPTPR